MTLAKLLRNGVLISAGSCALFGQTQDDFFDDSVIQEIRFTMSPRDWDTLKRTYTENTYYPIIFQWRNIRIENVGIRSRGKSSRSPIKPEFNVDFNRFEDNQLFLGMTGFKLDNNVTDASMSGERLTMTLFRKMGLPYLREAHTRLYVNNEWLGVYTIVDNINKNFLRMHYGEDEGYLYEYSWSAPYHFEWKGDAVSSYSPDPFDPKTHENNPNPATLRDMIRTINQASDADFVSAVGQYVDWKPFLTHLALEMVIAESDGLLGDNGLANFYVYNPPNSKRFHFIVWDKDGAFGSVDLPVTKNADANVLVRRALANPQLKAMYLEAVQKAGALAGGDGGALGQEIERVYSQIRELVRSDSVKPCTTDPKSPCPLDKSNQMFETNFDYLRYFVRERWPKVIQQVASLGYQPPASAPKLADKGVINAAPNTAGPAAPGSWVTIYAAGLGTVAANPPLGLTPTGASFWINGFNAPVGYISPGQANVQLPWEIGPGTVKVMAIVDSLPSNTVEMTVAPMAPGIFAIVHADGSLVNSSKPAAAGEVLVIYANGLGPVTAKLATGQFSPANPLASTVNTPSVTAGGSAAGILFSGLTPNLIGLYQINAQLPSTLPAGDVKLELSIGGASAPTISIAVK